MVILSMSLQNIYYRKHFLRLPSSLLPFSLVAHRAAQGAANLLSLLPSPLSCVILCHHHSFPESRQEEGGRLMVIERDLYDRVLQRKEQFVV